MNGAAAISAVPVSPWQELSFSRVFWLAAFILVSVVVLTAHPQYTESMVGAGCITLAALFPAWLWMSGHVVGLPLFPIYSVTYIGTYALPLLYEHPIVSLFPADNQLTGAWTVTGFLLVGTGVWYSIAHRPAKPLQRCLLLHPGRADIFFLIGIAAGTVLNVIVTAHWLDLDPGIFSIIRAIALAIEALGCFALAYRLGRGELSGPKALIFQVLFCALVISNMPSLLLINSMSVIVVAILGYTLGARRLPWLITILSLGAFAFLHAGKGDMRDAYWKEEEDPAISPWSYPSFLNEWVKLSVGNIAAGEKSEKGEEEQSLMERASLMQLLLYVQLMTPNEVPYMYGETYSIIPVLLVPRIFIPTKIASHEGTYRLNIHYGFQTREATETTTIGWGLLNESYANFGYVGVGMLAILLGAFYGGLSRWSRMAPVLSFRSLFTIIVASYAFQTEFAAGVYVSALFQSTCALLAVAAIFMRPVILVAGSPSGLIEFPKPAASGVWPVKKVESRK